MSQDVRSIRLIPLDNVTMLLREFAKVAKHEVSLEPRHMDSLSLYPLQKRAVREHQFVVLSPNEQRFKGFHDAKGQRHVVTHTNLVL